MHDKICYIFFVWSSSRYISMFTYAGPVHVTYVCVLVCVWEFDGSGSLSRGFALSIVAQLIRRRP